ncbi:hypothetical protein [Planomonospora sp. ID82291]|nr:hypothetical protein [Planomonospora sp. ID82291]MBG0819053.1 hypothetical protein [Planomonospora sp. ID82291]
MTTDDPTRRPAGTSLAEQVTRLRQAVERRQVEPVAPRHARLDPPAGRPW